MMNLHSVDSLSGWLTLRTSEVLLNLGVSFSRQWTVCHGVLVHAVLLEVGHHVCQPCLRRRLGSLLLDLVHLLKILLGCRIQLVIETFLGLSLQWSCFRFWNLIDLEAASHGRMHHDFAWSLNLLQAVEGHVIEVARAVQVPLLVSHDLFEEDVTTRFSLLFLEKKIISRGNLIMLIILNVSYGLAQIAVWTNTWRCETILDLAQVLVKHGNAILTDNDTFHFCRLHLLVPFVCPYLLHGVPLVRIGVENFSN